MGDINLLVFPVKIVFCFCLSQYTLQQSERRHFVRPQHSRELWRWFFIKPTTLFARWINNIVAFRVTKTYIFFWENNVHKKDILWAVFPFITVKLEIEIDSKSKNFTEGSDGLSARQYSFSFFSPLIILFIRNRWIARTQSTRMAFKIPGFKSARLLGLKDILNPLFIIYNLIILMNLQKTLHIILKNYKMLGRSLERKIDNLNN